MDNISLKVTDVSQIPDNGTNRKILQNCNLHLTGAGFAAIVGASGAGKSSLLYCMGGLDRPSQGSVCINGVDIYSLNENKRTIFLRQTIAFIFQQYNLIPYLNVRDNILLSNCLAGKQEDKKRLHDLLGRFGMKELEDSAVTGLSGGEQQRVALCRAMYQKPSILFADEPTGALDSQNTKKVIASLRTISDRGSLVIAVTHDPNVAEAADRVVFMADGSIVDNCQHMAADSIQKRIKELSYV